MPSVSLNVPHFRQEFDYSCVPACIRMVLAHHGWLYSEDFLRSLLGTSDKGTTTREILKVTGLGVDLQLGPVTLVDLYAALSSNVPPIVFLETAALPYWSSSWPHVAVLVGLDAATAYLNDPAFDTAPQQVSLADFMQA